MKSRKMLIFSATHFLKDSVSQITLINVNFHLKKSLEIFDKNSADKIHSKNYKGINPPCLMLIRIKTFLL